MVTIRATLNDDLTGFVHKSIQEPLDEFCACYACAGIKKNKDAAKKARGNHYGEYYINDDGYVVSIPVRRFIDAAIKDIDEAGNVLFTNKKIADLITKRVNSNPRVQKQEWGSHGSGDLYRETTQRALPVFKGGHYKEIFDKLKVMMEDRLRNAIAERNIYGNGKGFVSDIRHNTPSTVAKKGFDHPLFDTGEMMAAIQGWTNEKD